MAFTSFIGIDVSKLTIDAAIYVSANEPVFHQQFENRPSGFGKLLAWVYQHCDKTQLLFCLEHTGIYALPLCCFFTRHKLSYSLQSALHVKRSMGIQRAKNDKADARMLARFAYLYRDEIKPSQLPSKTLLKIQHLLAYRQRLVKNKVALEVAAKELANFVDKEFSNSIIRDSQKHIAQLVASIQLVDKQLRTVIAEDQEVHRTYQLATSVTGIGLQTAAYLLVHTQCFKSFANWRQLAARRSDCFAGTAPFTYSSGSSVRGRSKLSKIGHMKLKALLSNGANAAIQSPNEFADYYNRKILEGKPKLVALNGVRNKLISRVFAAVQRGTPYIKNQVEYRQAVSC
ncbi:IS110 family transposase [Spirosoma aureum]|uniref:IS110 family transposase n=1 Tax=Spirosoma aureum TaxID=2692134 RepID=A0A6G9ANB5_9BACT|nr:IS110 family transposase [Spirosoma aureum]QIP13765.1 IS110 family transposase [Spirosoma aureum]